MCLYPKLFINRKYTRTKKNGGKIPPVLDNRTLYVPIACGNCIECLKQKAREWQVRLTEELKVNKYAYFITLTFSNEELQKLCEITKNECNAVATLAVRRFLERWRKKYKKSLKHWLVTELGHENTERIHLHGIIFSEFEITQEEFTQFWKYGNILLGTYCNFKTINYIVKYVHKIDTDHKNYKPIILCSKGIGSNYTKRLIPKRLHEFDGKNTIEYYRLPNGVKINLPIYYRNKFWTEEQREQLWLHRLDKNERYVMGNKISNLNTEDGIIKYNDILKTAQEMNKKLGFGDDSKQWQKKDYNVTLKMLNQSKN